MAVGSPSCRREGVLDLSLSVIGTCLCVRSHVRGKRTQKEEAYAILS